MRLLHGEHNEELSDILLTSNGPKKFNDWVITTSFYASIHFVEHKIFPRTIDGSKFNSFNKYYDSVRRSGRSISKHNLKLELVKRYIKPVRSQYKRLMDSCMTARYINYNVSDSQAVQASRDMKSVKSACI